MKLLFLTECYPPEIGGVAASAGRISKALAQLGHDVDAFVLSRELHAGTVESDTSPPNLTVHRFGRSKNLDFTLQNATNFLEWLHGKRNFDGIWAHYAASAGFLGVWFGRLVGRPSVLSVRGNDVDRQLFPPGDFARLQWCLNTCHRVITVSKELATKVHALAGREAIVLPNAVDTTLFQPGKRPGELAVKYEIQPGELVLGFSGELRAKKGLVFLIKAFRDVVAERPARLLIIGDVRPKDRGDYERALAVAAEARQSVIVTGHLDNPAAVAEHLRLADVLLLPSLWDGMPNSLLEAMAAGVPVIASDAGAIPEVLTDGVTGLLVPKTHLHLLGQRVDELLAMSDAARRSLVEAARQHVCGHHTFEVEREALSKILAGLDSSES